MYTYLLLHVFTIFFPLSYSFDSKISFYRKWKYVFMAIVPVAIFFLVWDHLFTGWGVWNFNSEYVLGIFLADLPLEEWLFFVTVPFSCIFIYEALNYFLKKDYLHSYSGAITYVLVAVLILTAAFNLSKLYLSVTFLLTAAGLLLHKMVFGKRLLGRFYVAYLVHLIPFFIVNGVLTSLPVVIYNDAENSGIRLGTIPIEDTIYSMLLLLMNISIYEFLKDKKQGSIVQSKIYNAIK